MRGRGRDRLGNYQLEPGPTESCPCCKRDCPRPYMSKHHLRTKAVDREECVYLCRDCHGFIHALFTTRQIADPRNGLDTIPGLMARSEFRKAISFVQSVPVGRKVAIAKSRKRKRNTRGRRK